MSKRNVACGRSLQRDEQKVGTSQCPPADGPCGHGSAMNRSEARTPDAQRENADRRPCVDCPTDVTCPEKASPQRESRLAAAGARVRDTADALPGADEGLEAGGDGGWANNSQSRMQTSTSHSFLVTKPGRC